MNHSTINISDINIRCSGDKLEYCVNKLKKNGIPINDCIHISNDGLLHQASTKAENIDVLWNDGKIRKIPGPFVEFIQRLNDPNTKLPKTGFEPENAKKIFPSTNRISNID